MIYIAIALYLFVMTLANYVVFWLGPNITPVVAFSFIGFHLALRDWLQMNLRWWGMAILVLSGSACTVFLAPSAKTIAVASALAFLASASCDWVVFSLIKGKYISRSVKSNIVGSAVDSVLFPTIAFGVFMPHIIALQFASKVLGGAMWAAIISKGVCKREYTWPD